MAATKRTAAATPDTVTVVVPDDLLVHHDGEHRNGTLTVPAKVAAEWIAAGWVSAPQ